MHKLAVSVVLFTALVGCQPQSVGMDEFTDSDGLRIQTDKALWYCYKQMTYLSKSNPESDPYQAYYKCLFDYGVVI